MSNDPNTPGGGNDPFSVSPNPYAPTSNIADADVTPDDVEAYRRKYLSHEASVKSIGTLYMLGAIFLVPMGVLMILGVVFDNEQAGMPDSMAVIGGFYLAIGLLQGFTAVGLRRLQNWARIVAVVLSVVGLIGIPVGTLISAYFLYLLLSAKGKIVFSEQYRSVVEQTPHVKYKTSIVVWILLGLLVLLIAFGFLAAFLGG